MFTSSGSSSHPLSLASFFKYISKPLSRACQKTTLQRNKLGVRRGYIRPGLPNSSIVERQSKGSDRGNAPVEKEIDVFGSRMLKGNRQIWFASSSSLFLSSPCVKSVRPLLEIDADQSSRSQTQEWERIIWSGPYYLQQKISSLLDAITSLLSIKAAKSSLSWSAAATWSFSIFAWECITWQWWH